MSVNARLLAVALGACTILPSAYADEAANDNDQFHSGFRVYVDPETGRLVSAPVTDEQRAAAAGDNAFSQDTSRVTEAVATDGSKMYILNGEFELALSAEIDASGKRHFACGDASHAALLPDEHAMAHAPGDER